jgi:hypothetical protein
VFRVSSVGVQRMALALLLLFETAALLAPPSAEDEG